MGEKRYRLLSDNDGHDYIIEVGEEIAFYVWVEQTENEYEMYMGQSFEDRRMNINDLTFTDPQGWR